MGRAGAGQGHAAAVLRRPRRRPQRPDQSGVRRRCGLDRRRGRRAVPGRGALRGPVSRGQVGHRGARRGTAAGLEQCPRRGRSPPRRAGHRARAPTQARALRIMEKPEDLTDHQRDKLAWIAKTDPRVYRAYLLKEGLRHVFAVKGEDGKQALDRWVSWARRCRLPAFVELQRRIVKHRAAIDAALEHGLSQGLIESTNTKIRLLTRLAFGFRSPEALIALAMLALGGHRPALPGRS